jgi:hypothetical protein
VSGKTSKNVMVCRRAEPRATEGGASPLSVRWVNHTDIAKPTSVARRSAFGATYHDDQPSEPPGSNIKVDTKRPKGLDLKNLIPSG